MRVFFVGPSPEFITGQSSAFDLLRVYSRLDHFSSSEFTFFYNSEGSSSMFRLYCFLKFLVLFVYRFIVVRPKVIYLSISRSKVGFIKDLPVFLMAYLFRCRVVVHVHGSDFKDFVNQTSGILRKLIFYCYSRVDTAIVLTAGMKAEFTAFPMINLIVVSNSSESYASLAPVTSNSSLRILFMSNIIKSKGIFELMSAVSDIYRDGVCIKLDIAGSFVADEYLDRNEVEEEFHARFDSACMNYHGVVTGSRKSELFELANVVALPSYYRTEAQPIVLIEALSCGRFILSSDYKYIPEYITHLKHGWLVPDVSVGNLKDALRHLASSQGVFEETDIINRRYYVENFTQDTHCHMIFTLLLDDN